MKVLYLSNAMPEEVFNEVFCGAYQPSRAAQKYHILQIAGLVEQGTEVTALSVPPISRRTYSGRCFRYQKACEPYRLMPILNVPVLRNVGMFFYVFGSVLKRTWGKNKPVVLCDVLNTTSSTAALLACGITRAQTVGIVTDVPTKRAIQSKSLRKRLQQKFAYFILQRFDKYVFLTEAMNELINTKGRPYLVAEGHADASQAEKENLLAQKYEKKVCFYAGSVHRIYGIEALVRAFLQANVPNTELHIYGDGDFASELRKLSEEHPSVRYFGTMPNAHIVAEEYKASLLVNPRPTHEEYTKYSFPSKNMEYMASGTPLLTTKLPGMPAEYLPYVYLIEEENVQGMTQALDTLLRFSSEELFAFGQRAKKFVLQEKNHLRQAERLLQLLQESKRK